MDRYGLVALIAAIIKRGRPLIKEASARTVADAVLHEIAASQLDIVDQAGQAVILEDKVADERREKRERLLSAIRYRRIVGVPSQMESRKCVRVNWRRGLWQLWVIATVAWIGAVGFFLCPDEQIDLYFTAREYLATYGDKQMYAEDILDLPLPPPRYTVAQDLSLTARSDEAAALAALERAALLGFAPPLIALVLGAAIPGDVRGFAHPK